MAKLLLQGSVGKGGDNRDADVKRIRTRFRELGYHKVAAQGKGDEKYLVQTIKFFQALVAGKKDRGDISRFDGRITAGKDTHKWLAAKNAPCWVEVYGKSGKGWCTTYRPGKNNEVIDVPELWTKDHKFTFSGGTPYTMLNGGFATSWLVNLVKKVGQSYVDALPDAPPIWLRDCSPKDYGSDAMGHASHEMGRSADFRLPLIEENMDPGDKPYQELSSQQQRRLKLDREALEKQLELLSKEKDAGNLEVIIFQDDTTPTGETPLHREYHTTVYKKVDGKVKVDAGLMARHRNHIHVRVAVPTRIEGVIA